MPRPRLVRRYFALPYANPPKIASCPILLGPHAVPHPQLQKAVQLGKDSHFCPPQLAPEFKNCVALCRSVATWLQTERSHVAVVATSRQRAALLAVCIQAYLDQKPGQSAVSELYQKLGKQLFAMCDKIRGSVPECQPLRAHQFFLRHWARLLLTGKQRDIEQSIEEGTVDSAHWAPGGRVWINEVVVSGMTAEQNGRLVAMISQGEQLVFSSLNRSPQRRGAASRSSGLTTRVPIGRECDADADLVLRLYRMVDQSASERASQRMLCSTSFNVKFCSNETNEHDRNKKLTVTAADLDDADVPGSFRVSVSVGLDQPDDDDATETATAAHSLDAAGAREDATEPVAIPGAQRQTDTIAMSYSLDDDAALALSLQRQFDLESGLSPASQGSRGRASSHTGGSGVARGAEDDDDDSVQSGDPATEGGASTTSAEEQLAMDEAFARALQTEFNQAAQGRRRERGGSRRRVSDDHAALSRALHENPAEFLRMVMGESSQAQRMAHAPHCVATLPTGTVDVAQLGNECQVCFETYTIGETFRTLPCMHIFHKDCIDPWLLSKRDPTCPVCLTKIEQP